ncbi:zinc-binding dehydrogenase [Salirhabdus salicampi]|uniref:zinc-binding dehydrogenase n=1 Tax=Salirhabdus salicampi TaxID=476102 RepID=UPI0020C3F51C|nr:zinc-binding dehydrogenase [Salirhabdus salicampi]MCP8615258.1 zinc-binding dehydrogenase [Salirhabdus salicampi]
MKGKLVYLTSPFNTEVREYPIPKAEPGAVVLNMLRASVCGSDLTTWLGLHPRTSKDYPIGHEGIGEIHELGEGVSKDRAGQEVKKGDRVAFVYYPTCMECFSCLKGRFDQCTASKYNYVPTPDVYPHFIGTFATHHYLFPNQYFFKIPDNVPNEIAASANCALSQVYWGLEKGNLTSGEWLVIQGAGGLGLYGLAIAKVKGAKTIVIDSVTSRLDLAKRMGADFIININDYSSMEERVERVKEITDGQGADIALEVTGVPEAFKEGAYIIAPGGKYVELGNISPSKKTEISPAIFTRKSITIYHALRYPPTYLYKALQFLSDYKDDFPFHEFTEDKVFSLDEFDKMMDLVNKRQITRAAVVPNKTVFA